MPTLLGAGSVVNQIPVWDGSEWVAGPGFSTGQIIFMLATGAISADSNLFFDVTNKRLSIGAGATPTDQLDLAGSTAAMASLRIRPGTAPTSPTDGAEWYDSTQKAIISYLNGMKQIQPGVIFTSTANATVASTITETTILGTTGVGTPSLPANFFVAGKTIRIVVTGFYGTTGTPTLIFRVKFTGTGGATLVTSATIITPSGVSNQFFRLEIVITCRQTGSSATLIGEGYVMLASTNILETLNSLVATAAGNINTANAQPVDVTAQWGTANSLNTITGAVATIEALN